MNNKLTYRKAIMQDIKAIVDLLLEDELGKNREQSSNILDQRYVDSFHKIDCDPNQYLMVVEMEGPIVGTCHLTIMPSLTLIGSTRMNIESVRVAEKYRRNQIGEWMINSALEYGKSLGASLIQLTTNKQRLRAKKFYEKLGFQATHEGMKLKI
jgi:ribosomal protein S18 acetylase RimI-like enzyme